MDCGSGPFGRLGYQIGGCLLIGAEIFESFEDLFDCDAAEVDLFGWIGAFAY